MILAEYLILIEMKVQKSRKSGKELKVKKLDAFGHSNSLKEGNLKS